MVKSPALSAEEHTARRRWLSRACPMQPRAGVALEALVPLPTYERGDLALLAPAAAPPLLVPGRLGVGAFGWGDDDCAGRRRRAAVGVVGGAGGPARGGRVVPAGLLSGGFVLCRHGGSTSTRFVAAADVRARAGGSEGPPHKLFDTELAESARSVTSRQHRRHPIRISHHHTALLTVCCATTVRARAGPTPSTSAASAAIPPVVHRALSSPAATALALALNAPIALADPQTSECATNSCDDKDYSGRDLTAEFTKGSLKRAKFGGSNLAGVTLFGADLTDADFTGADLTNANLGQCNPTGTIFKDANLSGAIVSGANMDDLGDIDGSDLTDVIVRKDVNDKMCANLQGINAVTGNPTAMSLFCN